MTAEQWAGFFGGSLVALTLSLLVLILLAVHVVKKYPHRLDPERGKKRYTRPALILVIIAGLSFISAAAAIIGVMVTLVTS